MNDALTQYGYPKDAILSPALATTLAKNIQARFLVTSTLAEGAGRPLHRHRPDRRRERRCRQRGRR